MQKNGSLLGGILLIAGTCIGGGVLALPVSTSLGGFAPSIAIFLLCWAFMASTGLLMLEVCHWTEGETNLISMAEKTLGSWAKYVAWIVYLFLFYCLTVAYVVGGGGIMAEVFGIGLSGWKGSLLFVVLFSPFIFVGARAVGKLNVFMMAGLGISYLAFIFLGYQHVQPELLAHKNWAMSTLALPVVFGSFSFQGTIPTLSAYMGHHLNRSRIAILVGSFLPLIAYAVWEWLILGIVPADGLVDAMQHGQNAVQPLKQFLNHPSIYLVGQWFAFFAITTSFFGVTLGLVDFLADGLKVEKTNVGKILLCGIIFVPSLIIATINPYVFLQAFEYAGGFGCAILLGLFPILMVWSGRYHMGLKSEKALPGGKLILVIMAAFVLFEIGLELVMMVSKLG